MRLVRSCDGTFLSKAECSCEVTGAPQQLVDFGVLRGMRIDAQSNRQLEVGIQLTTNTDREGIVQMVDARGPSTGKVTSLIGCDRDENPRGCNGNQLFFTFSEGSPSNDMQCTYRTDWQAGPDAHVVAMGCNVGGKAPACYDEGEMLYTLWACLDPSHCPFHLQDHDRRALSAAAPAVGGLRGMLNADAAAAVAAVEVGAADPCSQYSTCTGCMENSVCSWCIGSLYNDETGGVHNGATCFSEDDTHQCSGTTLTTTCAVHKCPWFEYYLQAPEDQGDCSALTCTATTGDDPDFVRTNTPAQAYSTNTACMNNCVDPTVGCTAPGDDENAGDDQVCSLTKACNASSTCADCSDMILPTKFKGVEMDYTYTPGTWSLTFDDAFTTSNLTDPNGASYISAIKTWLFDGSEYSGTWAVGKEGTIHAVRMYLASSGALGQNMYLALSPDSNPIKWTQGMT